MLLPTSASRAVLLLLRPPIARIRSTVIVLDQPLERVLAFAGRLADRVAEAELAALRNHHLLQRGGEFHQFIDVLGGLADDRDLARRRNLALAGFAAAGVPGQILDVLGRDRFAGRRPAEHALDLGVIRIAVDDQEIALAHQLLRQPLHLRDERAGGVDQFELVLGRLHRPDAGPMPCAVIATRWKPRPTASATEAAPSTPLRAQPFDDLRVMDDVADRRDRAGLSAPRRDDVERAPHAPAIAELGRDDDPLGWLARARRSGAPPWPIAIGWIPSSLRGGAANASACRCAALMSRQSDSRRLPRRNARVTNCACSDTGMVPFATQPATRGR